MIWSTSNLLSLADMPHSSHFRLALFNTSYLVEPDM
jgi:hypothetical protein